MYKSFGEKDSEKFFINKEACLHDYTFITFIFAKADEGENMMKVP